MRKYRILHTLLFMAVSALMYGQNAVVVCQKDGQTAKFSFEEKPVVTFSGSNLLLTTANTSVQYPIYLLRKIALATENFTAVKAVEKDETQFRFQNGQLVIIGGEPRSVVRLYRLEGIESGQYTLDKDGQVSIPLQHLAAGIYVVKANQLSFKFRKP
mgnify:FL=1